MKDEAQLEKETTLEDVICCCDGDCHIIASEEDFQELLRGLQSEE